MEASSTGPVDTSSEAWRQDFKAIKDTLIKVRLSDEYCLTDTRQSIPAKERKHAAVIGRAAKYTEVNLKLIAEIQDNYKDPKYVAQCLDNLFVSNVSMIKYLQEEYSCLMVGGQFRPQTKAVYKSLQWNTSVYTPEAIDTLKGPFTQNQLSTMVLFRQRFSGSISFSITADAKYEMGSVPILKHHVCGYEQFQLLCLQLLHFV